MQYIQTDDGKVHAVGLCKVEGGTPFPAGRVVWVELCADCVKAFVKSRDRITAQTAERVELRALEKAAQATEKRTRARPGNPAIDRNADKAARMAETVNRPKAKEIVEAEKANAPAE